MKASRRHELKENELAHSLGSAWKYVNDNRNLLGGSIFGVVAIIFVIWFSQQSRAVAEQDAWRQRTDILISTTEEDRAKLDKLRSLNLEAPDDAYELTGLLQQGQLALQMTQNNVDGPEAEVLDIAEAAFEAILKKHGQHAIAASIANLGMATVEENRFALDDSEAHKEKARAFLQAVIQNASLTGMPMIQTAMEREAELDWVFSKVVFAPALPFDPTAVPMSGPTQIPGLPIQIETSTTTPTLVPVPVDQIPKEILDRAYGSGTAEPIPAASGTAPDGQEEAKPDPAPEKAPESDTPPSP